MSWRFECAVGQYAWRMWLRGYKGASLFHWLGAEADPI